MDQESFEKSAEQTFKPTNRFPPPPLLNACKYNCAITQTGLTKRILDFEKEGQQNSILFFLKKKSFLFFEDGTRVRLLKLIIMPAIGIK